MPKATKTSGYLVKIEAFVPAIATDQKKYAAIQHAVAEAETALSELGAQAGGTFDITPTRR